MPIKKEIRDKIVAQSIKEIQFARTYRQGKVKNWVKNEKMYYGFKEATESSRANIDLGRAAEFVETILSKIDNPLIFKYTKRKASQVKRALRANAVREYDRQTDWWDIKDIAGKMQCILYGRAIYSYYADSMNGYKAHLENVDVYDFLIDPSAGGLDIERARYMGRYGVRKNKTDLKQGVKDGIYLKYEVDNLVSGDSGFQSMTQEEINKKQRRRDQNVFMSDVTISGTEDYIFWEWYTTFDGERYYVLLTDGENCAVRIEKLADIFPVTKQHPYGAFPFLTYAYVPNLTEFWTPAPFDRVREVFMAQQVSINQMVDNSEQINKPMKLVSVGMIEDLSKLKYRKDGYVPVKGEFDVNKAVQVITTPPINTPITVYNILEGIQEKASGVTAGAKGVSEDTKVGIYEGNQANAADRFGLFNKSYSFAYTRLGMLHQEGMRQHLTKKIAIQIMGPEGIEEENVSARDIFRKDEDFTIGVEASNAETALSEADKKNKLSFLTQEVANQNINPRKSTEMKAEIIGFAPEEIRELMDTSEFGDAMIMSEADRDIEALLDGKKVKPNKMATTAYKQRIVDFMLDHEEDMNDMQKERLFNYMDEIESVIISNMVRKVNEKASQEKIMQSVQVRETVKTPEVTNVQSPELASEPQLTN